MKDLIKPINKYKFKDLFLKKIALRSKNNLT